MNSPVPKKHLLWLPVLALLLFATSRFVFVEGELPKKEHPAEGHFLDDYFAEDPVTPPKTPLTAWEASLLHRTARRKMSQEEQTAELATLSIGAKPADPTLPGEEKPTPFVLSSLRTTPSGLQYFDHIVGEGISPKRGDLVTTHERCWFTDGSECERRMKRDKGKVTGIRLDRLYEGLIEGLQGMKVGGKRLLIIPAHLHNGLPKEADLSAPRLLRGRGAAPVPLNAMLVYEITLMGVYP